MSEDLGLSDQDSIILPQKQEKFKRLFLIMVVVLLVVVGLVFAGIINNKTSSPDWLLQRNVPTIVPKPTELVQTPTTSATANWKTYTNNIHGYSLQIPADYEVGLAEDYANPEDNVGIVNKKKKINIGIITDAWTSVCANSSGCEKTRMISLVLEGKNYPTQEYYVNRGYPYANYSFQIESGITTKKKTTLYLKVDYNQPKSLEEISQILSTFKLIN